MVVLFLFTKKIIKYICVHFSLTIWNEKISRVIPVKLNWLAESLVSFLQQVIHIMLSEIGLQWY